MTRPAQGTEQRLRNAGRVHRAFTADAGDVGDEKHQAGRREMLMRLARKRRPVRPWVLLAAIAVPAALLALWIVTTPSEEPVSAAPTPLQAETHLEFADGTRIQMGASSRGRVQTADERGARILVERGHLMANIAERTDARWIFTAGKYEVVVHGTRFELNWFPDQEKLELQVYQGTVAVSGPGIPGRNFLRGGESLMLVKGRPPPNEPERAMHEMPTPKPDHLAPDAASGVSSDASIKPPKVSGLSWSSLVTKGRHEEVLAVAQRQGIDSVLTSASASKLAALADAARYAGRSNLEQRAHLALRERFASDAKASKAAFLLGRGAHERNPGEALRWYDIYLQEQPHGTFAGEALGWKMVALQKLGRLAEARVTARRYLKRYPSGAHAAIAEQLSDR